MLPDDADAEILSGGSHTSSPTGESDSGFGGLSREMRRLRNTVTPGTSRHTEKLAQIELDFWKEVDRLVTTHGTSEGNPVVAELQTWRRLSQRFRLADAVDKADRLIDEYVLLTADAWRTEIAAHHTDTDCDGCFQRLLHTTRLQLTAQTQVSRASIDLTIFATARETLREESIRCLEREAPTDRQREQWTSALVDHCDMLLTAIDQVPPDRAATEIDAVAADIQWHYDNIETRSGKLRRRLGGRLRRLRAEQQERDLQFRLEQRFGQRFVSWTERFVLALICLVVVLMIVEVSGEWSPSTILWFNIIDAAACVVFLSELAVKLHFVQQRWTWFRRHFLIDFVPSIPVGLCVHGLTAVSEANLLRSLRLARFLRLSRLARYVRLLRPLIRVLRGMGLLARGLDRLTRRYGHIINRTIILHPTHEELNRGGRTAPTQWPRMRKLRGELRERWQLTVRDATDSERSKAALARLSVLEKALARNLADNSTLTATRTVAAEEIPVDELIENLRTVTPEDVDEILGEELSGHLASAVRIFARPPFRWMPLLGACLPRINEQMSDAETVADTSRQVSSVLKRLHNAWFWVSDLYGTVTPSQFVDRVGTTLVNSASRPAFRLLMFGGLYLLLLLILQLVSLDALQPVKAFLEKYVGPTVMVVGSICLVILAVGWWMKRLAREATEFYERAAQAQFLSLTETFRSRKLLRDTEILYDRILRPEWEIAQANRSKSNDGNSASSTDSDASPETQRRAQIAHFRDLVRESLVDTITSPGEVIQGLESTVLLYRDWLDGAMFTDNDTRATSQLLGNPAVRQFLSQSGRVTARQSRSLQLLDLLRHKSLFGGPYLWFNLISRSITHAVASLLVDYSQNAVPLGAQSTLAEAERERYELWLATEDSAFEATAESHQTQERAALSYVTNAFTALHFLDNSPQRDHEIESRFGSGVLEKLRKDRSLMVRRVFGSLPLHERDREQRVVNLYALYSAWLADGRALLVPWYSIAALGMALKRGLLWIASSIQEIRRPELRKQCRDAARAHFRSAVRKIGRVRGPVVTASTQLRICMDPEYLGLPLPGSERPSLEGAGVDADLEFLQPEPAVVEVIEEARRTAAADMDRLQTLIDGGLLDRVAKRHGVLADRLRAQEHIRATAVAYLADLREVRRHLSASEILREVFRTAAARSVPFVRHRPRPNLQRKFKRYWTQHGFGGAREKTAAWHAAAHDLNGAASALCVWARLGEDAQAEGERILSELLLHPNRITEQLVALRTIQTLSVLDVLSYREHVYKLGQYADMGDEAGRLLEWNTVIGSGEAQSRNGTT